MPLIAYNINLDTPNVEIAQKIADKIRHVKGGFRFCKAMGVMLEDRNIAQVSMNLTDYTKTSVYTVFETVRMEARTLRCQCTGQRGSRTDPAAGYR